MIRKRLSSEERRAIVADVKANGPRVKRLAAEYKTSTAAIKNVIRFARDLGVLPAAPATPERPRVTDAMARAAAEAVSNGFRAPAIAAILGVSATAPYYWASKYGYTTPGRAQVRGNTINGKCPHCGNDVSEEGLRAHLDNLAKFYERVAPPARHPLPTPTEAAESWNGR